MAKTPAPGPTLVPYAWSDGTFRTRAQPAGGNLYSLAENPLVHLGGYLLDPTPSAGNPDGLYYTARVRICIGMASNRIFTLAHEESNGRDWFGEFTIPATVPGTDLNARLATAGARLQEYRFLQNDFALSGSNPDICGMYCNRDTGALIVGFINNYDSTGAFAFSHVTYSDANDLAGSTLTGPYNVNPGDAAHFAGQIIDIPAEWQAAFGGTHFVHNGIKMSIASRSSIGPNLAVINAANPQAGILREIMNFPHGDSWATSLRYLGGSGESFGDDPVWNFLSDVAGAFVIPGTDTLCYIGSTLDMRVPSNGTRYKDVVEQSDGSFAWQDGYNPYIYQGISPYAWLFDLNELVRSVADPATYPVHSHRPYWSGYIDIPGVDKRDGFMIRGACLHPDTLQVHLSIQRGAQTVYGSAAPRYEVMSIPGVSL